MVKYFFDQAMGDLTPINDQPPRYATAFTLHPQCSNESVLQICISRVGGDKPPKLFANMQQPADRSTVHFDARPLDF